MPNYDISFWLVSMGIIELVAVFIAVFVVFPSGHKYHVMLKAGFALMVFGLVVQVVRSLHYLEHRAYPVDVYFPMWICKDLGASVLIFYFAFIHKKATQGESNENRQH